MCIRDKLDHEFMQRHDISYINSGYYINTAVVCTDSFNPENTIALGAISGSEIGNVRTFQVPLESIERFLGLEDFTQISVSQIFRLLLDKALTSARVDSVHAGINLPQAYKGDGVIVTIIDFGFDFTHPVFLDSSMTYNRILGAWNQSDVDGNLPPGYSYGVYYNSEEALRLRATDDETETHGTQVAGIAAGSGAGTSYVGVAPNAELLLISIRGGVASLIDAINFASKIGKAEGKPVVVNMSIGTFNGPKDGTTIWDPALNSLSGPGMIYIAAAGNSGNDLMHLQHKFEADTISTFVDFYPDDLVTSQQVIIWSSNFTHFSYQLSFLSPDNDVLFTTPFIPSLPSISLNQTYGPVDNSVNVRAGSVSSLSNSGKPGSFINIQKNESYKVLLKVTSLDAKIHAWNQSVIGSSLGSWSFSGDFPATKGGDNDCTIGDPSANPSVITVGSYKAESGTQYGALSAFSSHGPTVDLRTKPDICSVGEKVMSAVNSFHTEILAREDLFSIEFNGKEYGFLRDSGTSFSSPMVTGIVALMLEANPFLSHTEAKDILRATARLDEHTGQIDSEGSNSWGWGKANAIAAVQTALSLVNTKDVIISSELLTVFPNPGYDEIFIKLPTGLKANNTISITFSDMNGHIVYSIQTQSSEGGIRLEISTFPSGLYVINALANNRMYLGKMVKM
jgi:hypothetical protein